MDALTGGDLFLFEGFRLDRRARALSRRDAAGAFVPIAVGSRALEVLDVLVGRAGDLVSRDEFMSAVWPETVVEETNLNVQIAALRRILDQGRADSSCIQTIPGRGYRFAAPVTRVESSTRLTSGRLSGNGAGGPIAEPPAPPNPATPSHSETARPMVRPRELKGLLLGSLAIVAGALFLVAAVVTASNWHPPLSGVAGPAPRLSIVVLPFTNLGDDRDRQNLANAMTENLTAELSLNSDLLVTSRNTAFTYGNKLLDTRQIGRALSVRYVVEGSVQRSGNQLRVNAQLIDAETDTQLWAERFDRDTGDLFTLQSEIMSQLANALGIELIATEAARPTEKLDALDYILRGVPKRSSRIHLMFLPRQSAYSSTL
jgi:TolB-like protein/DNA-binding winged helix-turn-helix (wHTH) protein